MKFKITRTSTYMRDSAPNERAKRESEGWSIEINDLSDLLELSKNEKQPLIVWAGENPEIEIYDDYRE